MQYELVYYVKEGRKEIKKVLLSSTLKDIDNYIIKKKINNILTLQQYTFEDNKKAHNFSIISKDNIKQKPILFFDDLNEIYDNEFLYNLYYLYSNDEAFKSIFENTILYSLTNIKEDNYIKNLAMNVIRMYPSYDAFYKFYMAYLEIKADNKINYSKYRKFGEVYIKYINEKQNKRGVKKNVKNF